MTNRNTRFPTRSYVLGYATMSVIALDCHRVSLLPHRITSAG